MTNGESIETLFVSIEGDFSNLLSGADEELDKAKGAAGEIGKAAEKAGDSVGELGDEISRTSKETKEWTQEAVKAGNATEKLGDDAGDTGNKVKGLGSIFSSAAKSVTNFFSRTSSGADKAGKASGRARDKLGRFIKTSEGAGDKGSSSIGKMGAMFGLAAAGATKLLDIVINIASSAGQALIGLAKGAIQVNSQFETFGIQFETLLGSAGLAQEKLEQLEQFGVETPFELPEIVEASKALEIAGGAALNTDETLRLVGDAASAANAEFQGVALWTGRMFDALQSGRPFGEASARLNELGILSNATRAKMEEMQKAGADGNEIFQLFADEGLGKFSGGMEKLSQTFAGVISNLEDFKGKLLRVGGAPFFDAISEAAQGFLGVLEENEEGLTEIAVGLGEIGATVVKFFKEDIASEFNVEGIVEQLKTFVDWLQNVVRAGLAFVGQLKEYGKALLSVRNFFASIMETAIAPFVQAFDRLRERLGLGEISFKRLDKALVAGAQFIAIVSASVKALVAAFAPLVDVIGNAGKALFAFITGDFKGAAAAAGDAIQGIRDGVIDTDAGYQAFRESILQSAKDIDRISNPVEKLKEKLKDKLKVEIEVEEVALDEAVLGKIDSLSDQMIDATRKRNEDLAKLEESHAEKIDEIVTDAAEKRLEIQKDADEDLVKNDQETEEKRLKVIEDARTELSKLGKQTDREIESRRDEFQKDELRDTEDHLKAMRELTDNFLASLQDAVKNRDARAVVDLQAKFQQEKSEREEDFGTKQSRGSEDQDQELATIREAEAQKRDEILASQAEELAQLQSHNEQKRAEIIAERDQELADLDSSTQERLDKENEAFGKRQEQLNQALAKQLESIAESLAKQKDVTEEGAQAILETLNETFGAGGDIDGLMKDFAKRRSVRAEIKIDFETKSRERAEKDKEAPQTPIERIRSGLAAPGGRRLGGVQAFAKGGTLIANKPTLALFGEAEPEVAQFTPMSELSSPGGGAPGKMIVELTGSAPPGVGTGDRDAIAGVLLTALRDTGALAQ